MRSSMRDPISVRSLMTAIRALAADRPVHTPGKWYRTQKQHWLGWLSEYSGPCAYGRQTKVKRDARFAHNHIVEPLRLLYLPDASGVDRDCWRLPGARAPNAQHSCSSRRQSEPSFLGRRWRLRCGGDTCRRWRIHEAASGGSGPHKKRPVRLSLAELAQALA
jgi:hypothetical protein